MAINSSTHDLVRAVTRCRICGGADLIPFLDLGKMPLVNRYLTEDTPYADEPRFPLEILFCRSCCLSQLSLVLNPEVLYGQYSYFSSVSATFREHCNRMARGLRDTLDLGQNDLVMEIASNDGCLLSQFKALDLPVLGIEPAGNIAQLANDAGLRTLNRFWNGETAKEAVRLAGQPRLIVATNVLAHVDDLHGFLEAVASTLRPDGFFAFEVPYMVHFMNRSEFDTTYHEHLSYFLLRPLVQALSANGLSIVDVQEFEIHGGTIRVLSRLSTHASPPRTANVDRLLRWEEELGLYDSASYLRFAAHVSRIKEELTTFLSALKGRKKKVAAYGASAKGNVLLNYCGLGRDIVDYVVDDTPEKQGKFYPGNRLPVVNRDHLRKSPPDYLLLLAWNFVDELVHKTGEFRAQGGRYIVPIPSLRVM